MLKRNSYLIFSLLFSLISACYVEHRVFLDLTAVNNDVRNQIYWIAHLVDPTLFPKDFIASYFSQDYLISPILKALYAIATHWISPLQFSQFLPFVLVLLSTFYLFKLAELYAGYHYAFWISFTFNLYIWVIRNLAGGLPRAFFYPLFFLFLWLLTSKRYAWIILCFYLQVLIYPPAFFLSLLILFVELFLDRTKNLIQPIQTFNISLGLIGSFLILAYRYIMVPKSKYNFGALITIKEALTMPEFYQDGRVKIFPIQYELINTGIDTFRPFDRFLIVIISSLIFLVFVIMAYKQFLKLRYASTFVPRYIWSTAACSIILYILAFPCMFYLYVPDRYIYYSLPLVVVFFGGSLLYQLESFLKSKRYISWIVALLILLIVSHFWKEDLINLNGKEKAVYSYFRNVSKSAVIAAPIKVANNIPAFSYRKVLFSYEANIPFHSIYEEEIETRIKKWKRAYYARNPSNIKKFTQRYHIDYLVVDRKDFKTKTNSYFAQKIPNVCKAFTAGQYTVISAQKCF